MKKKTKIRSPLSVIKGYLLYDWLYYFLPFVTCLIYCIIVLNFRTLQFVVNSIYANGINLAMAIGLLMSTPNVILLIYCQKRVLKDMPEDILLKSASSERYGGAGCGKTSSAVLQAIFEAHEMEQKCTTAYYYIKSNYYRWLVENPTKVKDFYMLKKSVLFWREHPEYIPFLGSNVVIHDTNGRRSFYVDGDHLSQKEWLPAMFMIIDEAGNEVPQDAHKDRPADLVLFFRYIRHFGFKASLLEQKKDGILINVRAVLGSMCLAMGQSNRLLPSLLIDIISSLKKRLKKYDSSEHPEVTCDKRIKMDKRFHQLGKIIEKLEDFSSKIGFRIWHQLYISCPSAENIIPPEQLDVYCTNAMPVIYDDREFSQLYLPLEGNPVKGNFVTKDSVAGKKILRSYFEQQENNQTKSKKQKYQNLKLDNGIIAEEKKQSSQKQRKRSKKQ